VVEQLEAEEVEAWTACAETASRHVDFGAVPAAAFGLAKAVVPAEDHEIFVRLHDTIVERHRKTMAGWGGVDDSSGRQRCYGYFRNPAAEALHARSHSMRELAGGRAAEDREANRRASSLLEPDDLPEGLDAALDRLCACLAPQIAAASRSALSPARLVAAQPNLHNGRRYLRPHLDEPLHDGFGVVIVTVAVRGSATVLLQTDGAARQRLCFRLESGGREAYALSGAARDACLHGVLADEGGEPRCSLNLRFGLHSPGMEGEFPAGRVGYGGAGEALGEAK